MIDLLALLKRLEFSYDEMCPECCYGNRGPAGTHASECQLKAAIDALERGDLVIIPWDAMPDPRD